MLLSFSAQSRLSIRLRIAATRSAEPVILYSCTNGYPGMLVARTIRCFVSVGADVKQTAGQLPLVVTTKGEYADRMEWLFPKEPFIPRPVARFWSTSEVDFAKINQSIWQAVASSQTSTVEELATQMYRPALVIWCKEDRIFHVTGAEVLNNALPNSTLITPDRCGHLPMLDRPKKTGKELLFFLDEIVEP